MKKLTFLTQAVVVVLGLLAFVLITQAADKKPKPYPLDACVVTDEKLGADPGMTPHVFIHEGREVKLCCKSCLKEFNKSPAKYVAKIEAAEKKKK
jgi:hypothetical protein